MAYRGRVVLLGDSITQQSFSVGGWGARLADLLQRKADVFNRGYSGFTTRSILPLLPHLFPPIEANNLLVTVFFGANDSCVPGGEVPQHVPVDEYKANLVKILQHVKRTAKHVIVIAPPPVDSARWPNRSNEIVATYAAAASAAAKEEAVGFVDTFASMSAAAWPSFLNDGLHFSVEGNEFLFNLLSKALPFSPDALPFDFPQWREMHYTDPSLSLAPAAVAALPYPCWVPTAAKSVAEYVYEHL